jgi:GNAT superfamily N-acetyltransferase
VRITVRRTTLKAVLPWREKYRNEMDCHIVGDSHHRRGFTNLYLIRLNSRVVGYGCVAKGKPLRKGELREFWVDPKLRGAALPMFRRLIAVARARYVVAQTNDRLLTLMLFDCTHRVKTNAILFHDRITTRLPARGARFRRTTAADRERLFKHHAEPEGDWVLEVRGRVVATGGILFHYNPPYGDLYMEVAKSHRRRGYGSYLIQELKRVCYRMGKVPAARTGPDNLASRATLQRAGMLPCGRVLSGRLA